MSAIVPPQPVRREVWERPKARFFGFVSLMWAPVFFIAITFLDSGLLLLSSRPEDGELRAIAWWLIAPEIVLILLAVAFWRFEKPRRVVRYVIHDLPGGTVIH
jgi:hypothetical protein